MGAGCGALTCWGTGMLVSWRGDTWPGLACTLVWTSSRCEGRRKDLSRAGFPGEARPGAGSGGDLLGRQQ